MTIWAEKDSSEGELKKDPISGRSTVIPPRPNSNSSESQCKICGEYFSDEDRLNQHLKVHEVSSQEKA